MEKLSSVNQTVNLPVLNFMLTSGRVIDVLESDILAFIEANSLNVSHEGEGLASDPYGIEVEVITDAAVYLDNNFDAVTKLYFNSILINSLFKA